MDEFTLIWKFYSLDGTAGVANEFVVTGAFFLLPANPLGISVFIHRPHRIGVEARRNIEMFACFRQMSCGFGFTCLLFPAGCGAREFARDVNELLDSSANFLKIALNPRAAVTQNLTCPSLIPVDSPRLDDLIQYPALVAPAFHFSFCFDSHAALPRRQEKPKMKYTGSRFSPLARFCLRSCS